MRLVEDLPTGAEQISEPPVPDQLPAGVTGPGQKSLIDLDDGSVGKRGQVPARRVLVQVVRVVVPGQPQLLRHVRPTRVTHVRIYASRARP